MRKAINLILLTAAASVIAACALLPGIVSVWQDGKTLGQNQYEPISNIALDIRDEEESASMAVITMMCRMDGGIEISESMAAMTSEEAQARAFAILQEYVNAGLVEAFDPVLLEIRCMLATVTADPSLNRIFWMVVVVSADDHDYAQFDLAMDDKTGCALAVSYTREPNHYDQSYETLIASFAQVYFHGLGIENCMDFATNDLRKQYTGETAYAVRYRFGDLVYGELNVDLFAHKYGFYTEFPDLEVNECESSESR